MSAKPVSEWLERPETESRLHVTYRTLRRLVEEGRIGTLKIPGVSKTLYCRRDVEELVRVGTRTSRSMEVVVA